MLKSFKQIKNTPPGVQTQFDISIIKYVNFSEQL